MRLCILLLFIAATASAQIPNAGFETWTGGNPTTWTSNNIPSLMTTVTKSTTAHQGSAAAKGEVVTFMAAGAVGPVLQSGVGGEGFTYAGRPANVQGYYQFSPQGGDEFAVNTILYKGGIAGTAVGTAAARFPVAKSSYTQFTIPFTYHNANTPDLCVVQILIYNSGNVLHAGSWFLVDDLSFLGGTSVADNALQPASFELKQNYPNPFNPSTTIAYAVPVSGRVQVKVYDRLGTEIAAIVDKNEEAGNHSVQFNANGLASGVYFVSLRQGSLNAVRPMLLVK